MEELFSWKSEVKTWPTPTHFLKRGGGGGPLCFGMQQRQNRYVLEKNENISRQPTARWKYTKIKQQITKKTETSFVKTFISVHFMFAFFVKDYF